MARRTEKEETEFKVVPEAVSLCVNCGVAGISAANNLCQNCCNAPTAASTSAVSSAAAVSLSSSVAAAKPSNHVNFEKSLRSSSSNLSLFDRRLASAGTSRDLKKEVSVAALPMKREVNRCSGCRRKIGLTGFRCRCGELFCADHRYSDRHDCSYDYKTAGREAIARENPVVKAVKIVKI